MRQIDKISNSQEQLFAIYHTYKKIGTCVFCIVERQTVNRTQQTLFPKSWFVSEKSEYLLPFLKITGLETVGQRKQGNGRLCLQAMFECSQRYGCAGRMMVDAAFGSAPFYEHCGFKGGNVGQDGPKCFEVNKKSLSLLHKGSEQEGNFKLIPLPIQNSVADKELFDRMMMKAQHDRQKS